jgi:hypothetical protein
VAVDVSVEKRDAVPRNLGAIGANNSILPISPLKPMLRYVCEPTTKLIIGGR